MSLFEEREQGDGAIDGGVSFTSIDPSYLYDSISTD